MFWRAYPKSWPKHGPLRSWLEAGWGLPMAHCQARGMQGWLCKVGLARTCIHARTHTCTYVHTLASPSWLLVPAQGTKKVALASAWALSEPILMVKALANLPETWLPGTLPGVGLSPGGRMGGPGLSLPGETAPGDTR